MTREFFIDPHRDTKAVKTAIASIIATLAECPDNTGSEGACYLALQTFDADLYTLHSYTIIVTVMERAKLVTRGSNLLTLTPVGLEFAEELNAKLREAR